MQARTSKEVTDRQKLCHFLLAALLQQGGRISERLDELVRPHLREGDGEPQFLATLLALARYLEASMDQLVVADERIYAANVRLQDERARRARRFSRLARKVARLRLTLLNQFVHPAMDALGLEQETARTPIPLLRQADRLAENFRRPDLDGLLGEPHFQQPVDPRPQAEEIPELASELRETLVQVDEAVRQFDEALIAKEQAMESHDLLYLRTARNFEDSCRMVGENELADRVRPTERRPAKAKATSDEGSDVEPTDGETSEESAAEAARVEEPAETTELVATSEPDVGGGHEELSDGEPEESRPSAA